MAVLVIVLSVLVVMATAIAWRPATALAAAICVYSFEQWAVANSSIMASMPFAMNYAMGGLTLLAMASILLHGRNPLNPVPMAFWVWLGLYLYAGFSCIWSIDQQTSIFLYKYHLPYVVTVVALVPLIIQKPEDVHRALMAVLIAGSIVMVLLFFGTRIHSWGRTVSLDHGVELVNRVGGKESRLSPLAVADMAGILLIIAMLMNFRGKWRIWQVLRWGVALLALVLIFRSQSRGQLFGSLLAVVTFIAFSRGLKQILGVMAAGISVVLIGALSMWAFSSFATSKRWELENMENVFRSTRLEMCSRVLEYWTSSGPIRWIFGLGSSASYDTRVLGQYPHVVPVEVLAELGLIGFSLLMLLAVLVVRALIQIYYLTKDSTVDRGVFASLAGWTMFQAILCLKQSSFLGHTTTFACVLIVCRYATVLQLAQRKENARRRWYEYSLYQQWMGRPMQLSGHDA